MRRYDEANGTDPVPDQVKKACIISNTPEPLKTHLQLNVGKLGNFNAFRVATEDYLRSRRIFKTTSAGNTHDEDSMEVDVFAVFLHCTAVLNCVRATHGLPADRAPVYCGCPCRDPLGCPLIPRQNGLRDKAPTLWLLLCCCNC